MKLAQKSIIFGFTLLALLFLSGCNQTAIKKQGNGVPIPESSPVQAAKTHTQINSDHPFYPLDKSPLTKIPSRIVVLPFNNDPNHTLQNDMASRLFVRGYSVVTPKKINQILQQNQLLTSKGEMIEPVRAVKIINQYFGAEGFIYGHTHWDEWDILVAGQKRLLVDYVLVDKEHLLIQRNKEELSDSELETSVFTSGTVGGLINLAGLVIKQNWSAYSQFEQRRLFSLLSAEKMVSRFPEGEEPRKWIEQVVLNFEKHGSAFVLGDWLNMSVLLDKIPHSQIPDDLKFRVQITPEIGATLYRRGKGLWMGKVQLVDKGIEIHQKAGQIFALQENQEYLVARQGLFSIDTKAPRISDFRPQLLKNNRVKFSWTRQDKDSPAVIKLYYKTANKKEVVKTIHNPDKQSLTTDMKVGGEWYLTIGDKAGNISKSKAIRFDGFYGCLDIYTRNKVRIRCELCLDYRSQVPSFSFTHFYSDGQLEKPEMTEDHISFRYHYSRHGISFVEQWELSPYESDKNRWRGNIQTMSKNKEQQQAINLIKKE